MLAIAPASDGVSAESALSPLPSKALSDLGRKGQSASPSSTALPEFGDLEAMLAAPISVDLLAQRCCALSVVLGALSPTLLDHQLHRYARRKSAWLQRGLLWIARTQREGVHKLTGGRGRKDTQGTGRCASLRSLVRSLGVSPTTLKTDAQIVSVLLLQAPGPSRQTRENSARFYPRLPRVYYLTTISALSAKEAIWQAIEMAALKRTQATKQQPYTLALFRKDIAEQFPSAASLSDAKTPVTALLNDHYHSLLQRLKAEVDTTASGVICQALDVFDDFLEQSRQQGPKSGASAEGKATMTRQGGPNQRRAARS